MQLGDTILRTQPTTRIMSKTAEDLTFSGVPTRESVECGETHVTKRTNLTFTQGNTPKIKSSPKTTDRGGGRYHF